MSEPRLEQAETCLLQPAARLDLRASGMTVLRRGSLLTWLRLFALIGLDAVMIAFAWSVAQTYGTPLASPWATGQNPFSLLPILAATVGFIALRGLYRPGQYQRSLSNLLLTLTFSHLLLLLIAFLYLPGTFVSRSVFLLSWLLSVAFLLLVRALVKIGVHILREQGTARYPVFLVGRPEDAAKAIQTLEREHSYTVLSIIDPSDITSEELPKLMSTIQSSGAWEVFVCSWNAIQNPLYFYWRLRNAGLTLHILPSGLDAPSWKSELQMIGGQPALSFAPPFVTGSDFYVKRFFDFFCSALLLVLSLPIYLLIALCIRLDSPGPVFFRQARIGLHNRRFEVWKFRTMVSGADRMQRALEEHNQSKDGVLFKMKDDPRVTRIGHFLRRYSLDELPQVFNVLMGEMSLVGPRPLPVRDVERFEAHHFIRHEVLPGITGLWQVSGRSDITDFEEVVRLDMAYIEGWSLWLDLSILLRTVKVVLNRRGAY